MYDITAGIHQTLHVQSFHEVRTKKVTEVTFLWNSRHWYSGIMLLFSWHTSTITNILLLHYFKTCTSETVTMMYASTVHWQLKYFSIFIYQTYAWAQRDPDIPICRVESDYPPKWAPPDYRDVHLHIKLSKLTKAFLLLYPDYLSLINNL